MAIRLERDEQGLAVASLDSPPLNLFDREMFEALQATIEAVESDPPRALLIRAEGRAVSGGVNVAEFDGLTPERASMLWGQLIGAVERVEWLPLPVVFAAHALTLTAAFELALGCDLILAARSAKFGLVEKVVGLTPSMGGTQRLAERAGSELAGAPASS
ncbi:MAG TPA: enoyl-CoA hydratase/isomerase family protein [Solirubrobacterales bacterium]